LFAKGTGAAGGLIFELAFFRRRGSRPPKNKKKIKINNDEKQQRN